MLVALYADDGKQVAIWSTLPHFTANTYKHRRTAYRSLAILAKLSPSRPIDSSPQANASTRNRRASKIVQNRRLA
jgi:hypothetical protein